MIFEPQFPAPEPETPGLAISLMETGIRLSWETQLGIEYAIQTGESLGEWGGESVSETSGTGGVVSVDLEFPAGASTGFYRVVVQ